MFGRKTAICGLVDIRQYGIILLIHGYLMPYHLHQLRRVQMLDDLERRLGKEIEG
jgi:hypothetical protein